MAITNASLTTTASAVYTSNGGSATTVVHLCNYTGSPVVANVWLVPSGNSADSSTIIYSNVSLTGYNTLVIDTEKFIFSDGDAIYANVSVDNSVTATVSYIGI